MESHHDFERLALPQMEAAYNIAYWIVRSAPDAEDVVQDAYLRAYRAFDSWAGNLSAGSDIRPWLFTIVRNRAYQLLSQRKRRANVVSIEDAFASRDDGDGEVREPPSDDRSAEEILIRSAEQAVVRSALERLPQIFREVIILREWEELSYQAIADVVGVPIGTVMSRLARGRDLLGRHLAQVAATEATHVV